MATVDQDKQIRELFAFQDIIFDDPLDIFASLFSPLGKTIAREIDQIPLSVDEEMVDKQLFFPVSGEVMASPFFPVSILIREDLPTLLRPIKAYSGRSPVGHFFTFVLLITNSALLISIETVF